MYMRIILLILSFCGTALAQEMVEQNVVVTSTQTELVVAKKELQDLAVEKITMDLSKELLGQDKFEKNKNTIKNKIVRNSGRYISFVKPGELAPLSPGPGYTQNFVMRVSPINLKTFLQNSGLLNENETSPVVLPLISFNDRVGVGTYKWWQPGDVNSKRFLITQAKNVESSLRQAFKKQQFHFVRPMEMGAVNLLPAVFQNDRVSPEDREFIGNMFQAPIVIDGQVDFSRSPTGSNLYRIDLKFSAVQLSNNRPIADVTRRYETETGTFENVTEKKLKQIIEVVSQDLAMQVFEAWQRGSIGTNILRLTVRGDLPIKQREILKDKIRAQVPQIKSIRERLVSKDFISFEVDSSSTPKELGQRMLGMDINGAKFEVSSITDSELVLELAR